MISHGMNGPLPTAFDRRLSIHSFSFEICLLRLAMLWIYFVDGILFSLGCLSVLLCRVYLGVHSPADVVCGSICGCLILSLWLKVDNFLDHYISSGNNGKIATVFFSFKEGTALALSKRGNIVAEALFACNVSRTWLDEEAFYEKH